MSWTAFVVEEDLQMMRKYHEVRRKDPGLAPTSYEFRLKNRSGEVRDILLTVAMIPGTTESIASCLDITERKRAEADLKRSEERYRSILDNMEEAYYEVDLKGNIIFINRATARMIGYPESELLGRSFRDFMVSEKIRDIYTIFNRIFITGESAKLFDWEFVKRNNEKLVVEHRHTSSGCAGCLSGSRAPPRWLPSARGPREGHSQANEANVPFPDRKDQ